MQSTTGALEPSDILKRDKLGRVWRKRERREALVDEFERSGMSGAQFARLTGLNYSSFQNWVQRRRKGRVAGASEPGPVAGAGSVRLFEAVVESGKEPIRPPALPAASMSGLVIELAGGGRMKVESPVQLRMAAELLAMIAQATHERC